MEMTIDLKYFTQILLIFIGLTLILKTWTPPIPRAKQALIALVLGMMVGFFFEGSKEGLATGIIASQMIFWGEDYFAILRKTQNEIKNPNSSSDIKLDKAISENERIAK